MLKGRYRPRISRVSRGVRSERALHLAAIVEMYGKVSIEHPGPAAAARSRRLQRLSLDGGEHLWASSLQLCISWHEDIIRGNLYEVDVDDRVLPGRVAKLLQSFRLLTHVHATHKLTQLYSRHGTLKILYRIVAQVVHPLEPQQLQANRNRALDCFAQFKRTSCNCKKKSNSDSSCGATLCVT